MEEFNQTPADDNKEVDVIEISLDDEEINEWIAQLAMLKATKNPIHLDLDDDNELDISFSEGEENKE